MKRVLARTGCAALLVALGCWSPASGEEIINSEGEEYYFPFQTGNSDSFLEFVRMQPWDQGGSSYKFLKAYNCKLVNGYGRPSYGCNVDYEETGTLGQRKCIGYYLNYYAGGNRIYTPRNPQECSPWKEVAAEPPKEKPPEPPASQSVDQQEFISPEVIAVGGLVISFLAGLAGFAIGRGSKDD